ncbi:MAG TPA: hypothetical protein VI790_01910 [Candidatus Nanoarchaeia archaeon]|nr:hypothetical protein [Candidatus Nanoarchaeia archaeon]
MNVSKSDEKFIDELARTKTVRELARVLLSYMTVEQMAQFVSTYMVFKSADKEELALNYFIKDQFFPLLKTLFLSMGDLLPDFISDKSFMKLYTKMPKKLVIKKE